MIKVEITFCSDSWQKSTVKEITERIKKCSPVWRDIFRSESYNAKIAVTKHND